MTLQSRCNTRVVRVAVVEPTLLFREAIEAAIKRVHPSIVVLSDKEFDLEVDDATVVSRSSASLHLNGGAVYQRSINLDECSPSNPLRWLEQKLTSVELRTDSRTSLRKTDWKAPAFAIAVPTEREIAVLHGVAAGLTTSNLAQHLGVAESTVRSHRRKLYAKWGAHSAGEAVAIGRQGGYLPKPTTARARRQ